MFNNHDLIYPALALAFGLVAAVTDIRSRRIPNWLTIPALLLALMLHTALDGWRGLLGALAAGAIAGIIFLIFHLAGGMGAGDVKLIIALAAMEGLQHTSFLLIFTSLAGGVMALALAFARGQLLQTMVNVFSLAKHHGQQGLTPHPEMNVRNKNTLRLPYGIAIAAGCLLTLCVLRFGGVTE